MPPAITMEKNKILFSTEFSEGKSLNSADFDYGGAGYAGISPQ